MKSQPQANTILDSSVLDKEGVDVAGTLTIDIDQITVQTPTIDEIFETIFGLRSQELAVYKLLVTTPGLTTKQLADELGKDRSNINRSLTVLRQTGLVDRRRRILEAGGFFYEYFAAPEDTCIQVTKQALERWQQAAQERLETKEWQDYSADIKQ